MLKKVFLSTFISLFLGGCATSNYSKDVRVSDEIISITANDGSYKYVTGKNEWYTNNGKQTLSGCPRHFRVVTTDWSYVDKLTGLADKTMAEQFDEAQENCGAKSVTVRLKEGGILHGSLLYFDLPPYGPGQKDKMPLGATRPLITIPSDKIKEIKKKPENIYSVYETYLAPNEGWNGYSWILWLSAFPLIANE